MSPSKRSQFLLNAVEEILGTSATNVVIGTCPHTCEIQVNMGQKNPVNIGRRSHYVSDIFRTCIKLHHSWLHCVIQCPVCRRSFLHDLGPHSAATQAQLRDRLHAYDTTEAAKTAGQRAETVAARTAQRAIERADLRARLAEKGTKGKRKVAKEDRGVTMTTGLSSPSDRQTAHDSELILSVYHRF